MHNTYPPPFPQGREGQERFISPIDRAKNGDFVQGKALKTLAAMCAQLISAMGNATHPACKSEDDRRLLQQGGLSQNMQLAVRYRLQLKLFIQAALALVLNKLKQLPPTK